MMDGSEVPDELVERYKGRATQDFVGDGTKKKT